MDCGIDERYCCSPILQLLFQVWTNLFYSLHLISEEIMQVTDRRHYKLYFKSCRHVITLLQTCFAYVGGSTRICFLILTVKIPIVEIIPLNGNRKKKICLKTFSDFLLLDMKSRAIRIRRYQLYYISVFQGPVWISGLLSIRSLYMCFLASLYKLSWKLNDALYWEECWLTCIFAEEVFN